MFIENNKDVILFLADRFVMEVAHFFRSATAKTAAEKSRPLKRGKKRQFKISTSASYYYNYVFAKCTTEERDADAADRWLFKSTWQFIWEAIDDFETLARHR